jgi:hypothetical protein
MRIHQLVAIVGLTAALAAPAAAQEVKKVGSEVHHTLKAAGRDAKQDAKDAGAATHHALKKAGNATKTDLGEVTGIHKVGGSVGAAAQSFSRTGKSVGRKAKHTLKKKSSSAHRVLKKEGNETKAAIKPQQ